MARIGEFSRFGRLLWWLSWPPARVLAMWWPYSVEYRGKVPRGPYVAAINHLSHLDPPFAGLALRRPMRFLALDELWGHAWILDTIFRVYGAIPLPRESKRPIGAIRAALRELDAGRAIGVFPEGRRVEEWGEAELKRGAAWLALRTGAPLVPVAIWGTQHSMPKDRLSIRRARIRVVVGEPLWPSGYQTSADPIGAMTEAWREVMDQELRRLAPASPG